MRDFNLRDYQRLAVDDATSFLTTSTTGRRLYAAPTGTGKSVIELAILGAAPDAWLITPFGVLPSMLNKLGVDTSNLSTDAIVDAAWTHRITTPIRLRNHLAEGGRRPDRLIIDETHHHESTTFEEIDLFAGDPPTVGFTATPYRGTPRSTVEFRRKWGEPVWVLTYAEASTLGYISLPTCRVVPLVDDDLIDVRGGEFVVENAHDDVSRFDAVASILSTLDPLPTMVAVPSVDAAYVQRDACRRAGVAVDVVTGSTLMKERQEVFRRVLACESTLIQINTVSEGVDLPLRRLVDLRPTLSPVYWLQLLGRITRPSPDVTPEYLCCCRNLERHGYLLDGVLPPSVIRDAQSAFPTPSTRSGSRVIGLESVGRFKQTELPLADGSKGFLYCVSTVDGHHVRQYAVLVHPASATPIVATRLNRRTGDGTTYDRWTPCDLPTDLTGFASVSAGRVSEKQLSWWKKAARRHGLDPDVVPSNRVFQSLPVLSDLKGRLQ